MEEEQLEVSDTLSTAVEVGTPRLTPKNFGEDDDLSDFDPFCLDAQTDSHKAKAFTDQYNIDRWYENETLKRVTFETIFVEMKRIEGQAITTLYQSGRKALTKEHEDALKDLKTRLDEAINVFKKSGKDAFVRLSTRSPKDAVLINPLLYENLKKLLPSTEDRNLDTICWYKAVNKTLGCPNAEYALDMLCSSSRSNTDITEALKERGGFAMDIIVREKEEIDPSQEFRAFIYNKKLTAVCQYYDFCYFSYSQERITKIKSLIQEFVDKVTPELPVANAILDLVIYDNYVKMIEINPFFIRTGAVMFNWEKDREILLNGGEDGQFVFRYIETAEKRRDLGTNVREKLGRFEGSKKQKDKCSIC